ncbi:hypothetical protein P8C59_008906 [Phyllachora maydis]|uniref:Reverse transcriptase Ty1/copia-type domain-containing protein n=1 Tax=Phyllachora maydis TaxID=1825666 RepID=A0AAD9IDD5_9PEZI|nr:hypothetical protein P8C59_008906 [Phyllachora maydis]
MSVSELYRPIDHLITLYGDNQGSIIVANDPALYARTKYTLLKFQYVREQVKAKIVTIIYLNTKYMPADGLTKALPVRQSSRPLPPIQTLLEDKEDGEDYSEVIEVLKHLNTLKASVEDSVSAIKNISSTLASLTNSSNATTTRKTSYSPRFNPFSGTMDLDSPLYPPRKEPYLGPAVNSATSNLDPPIDTGSKEGFKDTITSSIVKELSKKAYTIPDDSKLSGESNFEQWIQALSIVLRALGISNFLENPDISNTYSDSNQAVLLMLLRNSLSSSPRAAISRPIESKKEDVYNEFHALTFSTYKKGLLAFNAEFNGYLAKLTMAKIDIDPSLILNQYFKALESKFPSWVSRQKSSIRQARMLGLIASSLNIEYLMADILEESRNPAIEAYRAAYIANSSNSTPNSNSNPSKKGKNKKKGKKKASYNVKGQNYSAKSAEQASFMLGSYNLAIEEEEEESDSSSNSRYKKRKDFKGKGLKTSSNNKAKYKDNKPRRRPRDPALYNSQLRPINTGNSPVSPAGIGSITLEVLSRKAPSTYTKLVLDNVLYLPNIDINIVSRVRHYNSEGCLIKETLYGGDRRCIAVLDFKKSGFFLDVKGSSKPILHVNFAFPLGLSSYTTKSIELQRNKIVVEIPSNSIRKEDYRPIIEDAIVSEAIEPNKRYKLRNSPAKGTTLEGIGPSLRGKRPYRPTREPKPLTGTRDLPRMLREPVIEGNKVEKAISSPTLKEPNIGQGDYYNLLNLAKLWYVRLGHIGLRLLKKTSSITKGLPNFDKIKEADFHCSSCNRGKAVRRVSKALIPNLPRVLDSIEGDTVKIRPGPYNRNPIVLLLVNRKSTEITDLLTTWLAKRGIKFSTSASYIYEQNGLVERSVRVILDQRYRAIGAKGEAIIPLEKRSKSLKFTSRTEECKLLAVLGSKTYLVYIPSRRAVLKTSTVKFIEDNTVLSQPTDNTALEGELVDLDLDLEGAVSPDPSNLNTEKPISIEIGPSKLDSYKSSSDSELDKPLLDKPINPVIVESTRLTISIRKPELTEAFPQTIEPIFIPKPIEVIAPNQPITNEPLNNSDLISKGDKMQLDYYKLLAKTSSYILSFVYKARKRVISKDSTPATYKQVLKLPRDERSKWLEAITKEFIQLLELGVFKFLPRSLLPSNRKLITCRNVLKVKKDAKNRPIKYKSHIPPTWRILLAIVASNKAINKLLLKYSYNPSTSNIIKLSKALYSLKQSPREWQDKLKILLKSLGYLPLISDPGVFYNAKTCYFIVTYVDDCLFIGLNIGYITDLKKRLNKVYAIEDLGPAAYFLGVQIIRDRPNRRLWLNHQLQLEEDMASHLCNSMEIKLYQSLVGTAIYIMLFTRVDISFTVQWLSRSLNRPIKSHLNAAKNLFKYLNSTKDYSICFSCNGNTVADLGPKLSNSSNTTTKLSRDFHSKEGSRPLTTTSTTIVDSRNSKGSSRTSIINSSLVPIGFSDSDFTGDKATSKSTYGYLYKLAGGTISWKTKRATTIALSTLEAETDGLTEAIREVQWIIGLFSKLYRPIDYPITLYGDNQGSITVANDPALYARTKHTLLKFRYVREQVKAKIVTIIYLNTKCS